MSVKKKIIWFTTCFDDSAVSTVFLDIALYLQKSFDIIVLSHEKVDNSTQAYRALQELHIPIYSLHCKRREVIKGLLQYKAFLMKCNPDVVHAHLGRAYCIAGVSYRSRTKNKYVLCATFHNNLDYFSVFTKYVLKFLLYKFNAVTAVSQSCLQTYAKLLKKKRKHSAVYSEVIYNPLTHAHMVPEEKEQRYAKKQKIMNCSIQQPVFLVVSRLYKGKGHINVLRMFSYFLKKNANASLLFAGEGPLKKIIQQYIQDNHLPHVKLLGHIHNVKECMREAHVVLFPSDNEGFGLVPCEALLQGIPVITNDIPVMREIFLHSCWTIDCKKPLLFAEKAHVFLKNYKYYITCAQKERMHLQKYLSSEIIAGKYRKFYHHLLDM